MTYSRTKSIFICLLLISLCSIGFCGKIVRPWRATSAIVVSGESFEVWFDANSGQTVNSVELQGPYNSVSCSQSISTGNWEYDKYSHNTYDTKITVTVPADAPADRYELILNTSTGQESSTGAVKVIKEYKDSYYIMHMSDTHRAQGSYDETHTLRKASEIIKISNIIGPEIFFETGDNQYSIRNHPEREVSYYHGLPAEGIIGIHDAFAATFMCAGNHDSPNNNYASDTNVAETADFFNKYYGLHIYNFIYGNGRFTVHNNAWGGSMDKTGQGNDAAAWLNSVGWGNFVLGAAHTMGGTFAPFYRVVNVDLAIVGHNHYLANNNPHLIDGDPVNYVADSVRDLGNFEFNLFKVNNNTGVYVPVSGSTARCQVIQGDSQSLIADPSQWIPNLQISYSQSNDGSSSENTATIINNYNFSIESARVRFIMPKGMNYGVSQGTIDQQFDGDSYRVVDVSVDLGANSTTTVDINSSGYSTLPAGASARGENAPNETADMAFDGDDQTKWMDFSPDGSWIQWRYPDRTYPVVKQYSITSAKDSPGYNTLKINFQPAASSVPSGYLADDGSVYGDRGNGYSYGWVGSANDLTRDREVNSDQRYDTLNHMSAEGVITTWELAVPNGDYVVDLVMGDPAHTNQVNDVSIEGLAVNDPDGEDNFDEYLDVNVTVTDGKLTISNLATGSNAKICFIEILNTSIGEDNTGARPSDPKDFNLLGSNDQGVTWDILDSRTGVTFTNRFEKQTFTVAAPGKYNLYRLDITAVLDPATADSVQIAELQLLPCASVADFNCNGSVGLDDFSYMANVWLASDAMADVADPAGQVDVYDMLVLAWEWLIDPSMDAAVAYWKLDETTGVVASDYSRNGHQGTLINMDDSDWVPGNIGNALDFDGVNDYVATGDVCAALAGANVTVSAWMKAPALNPATQFIIAINTANGDDNKLLCGIPAGTATLSFADSEPLWRDTTATVIDNAWHHIAFVLNDSSDTVTVYVDGSEALSFASTVSVADTDLLSLGQEYDAGLTTGDFYNGRLDDVKVYDYALNETAIRRLYNPSGLLAHWELDETAGAVAADDSLYGYDGTLVNMDDSDWVPGNTGNALDFDGVNDHVTVDGICAAMAGKDVTVSAWVKAPAVNPATQFIISINTSTGDNRLLCGTPAGTATLSLGDTAWHDTTATVIDNTWHHIAYVLEDSSDTITVYVDGSDVLSFGSTISIAATDLLSLGQEYDPPMTPGDFYSGLLDDVRIYDRALTESEIATLAQ